MPSSFPKSLPVHDPSVLPSVWKLRPVMFCSIRISCLGLAAEPTEQALVAEPTAQAEARVLIAFPAEQREVLSELC